MDKWAVTGWGSRLVLWLGLLLIGILAVPTGILVVLISLVGTITDKAAGWVEKRKTCYKKP